MVTIEHEDARTQEALVDGVRGRRLAAWLIDAAIIGALLLIGRVAIFVFGIVTFTLGWSLFPALILVPFLYNFGFLAGPGHATPGQAIMGLTVRRLDGLPPNGFQALLSTGVYAGTLALGLETRALGLLLLLIPLFAANKRTLHDIVAGLIVVRRSFVDPLTVAPVRWTMRGTTTV